MMLGSRVGAWAQKINEEEEMYKELFLSTVTRTLTGELQNPLLETIGNSAFYGCTNLTSISLPNVTRIEGNAFYGCSKLTTLSLPKVEYIGTYAFKYCKLNGELYLPECKTLATEQAFLGNKFTSINLPKCTFIGRTSFQDMPSLVSANIPEVTKIEGYSFRGSSVQNWYIPKCTSLGYSVFDTNKVAKTFKFGVLSTVDTGVFNRIGELLPVDQDGFKSIVTVDNDAASFRAKSNFPWSAPTQTKFVCADGSIVYQDGAWVIVS